MKLNEYSDFMQKIKCNDEFRERMKKMLSSEGPVPADVDENVRVIKTVRKFNAGKIVAAAAAFLIVFAGAYRVHDKLSVTYDDPVVSEDKSESFLEILKSNKESFEMNEYLWNYSAGDEMAVVTPEEDKDIFFAVLDKNSAEECDSIVESYRSIRFDFNSKETDDTGSSYCFTIYENGYGKFTGTSSEKQEYFYYDTLIFEELLDMVLKNADDSMADRMKEVSDAEIEEFLQSEFLSSDDDSAVYKPDMDEDQFELYKITEKESIASVLTKYEWEKIKYSDFDKMKCYIMDITISDSGCMKSSNSTQFGCYRVKGAESLGYIMDSYAEFVHDFNSETDIDIREVFSGAFDGAYVRSSEGHGGAPMVGTYYYDSVHRSYTVSDAEGLVNDLSSLKWEKCSRDEYDAAVCTNKDKNEFVRDYEIDINSSESVWNSVSISENGYIHDYPYYYRLADENEIQNDLHMIFEKYFVQTEESKLAEKISVGKTSFSNLDAHYTYELKTSYADCSLSGKLSIDHDGRDLMYMTGEGIFDEKDVSMEMVVNGENDTVYRMIDNETGEPYLKFAYGYNSASLNLTRLGTQYYYICRDIENSLMMNVRSKVNNFLHIQLPADELCEYYWSCTTENSKVTENYHVALKDGVLVSYEKTNSSGCHERFNLEKYTIDLDEFEFEKDVPALYDEIFDQLTEYEGGRSDDEP